MNTLLMRRSGGSTFLAPQSVNFVAATGTSYTPSGTTINAPAAPAGVVSGDGLFAIVMSRSALTPPAGWSLVKSQSNTGASTQTVSIFKRDTAAPADSGASFTWTQAASGRMGLGYLLARSTSGALGVLGTDSASNTGTAAATQSVTLPVMTASGNGELFLLAAASELGSDAGTDTWVASSGATIRTTAAQAGNRLCAETQARDLGQSNSTPMTITFGAASASVFESVGCRIGPV